MTLILCDYCSNPAVLTTGDKLYPNRPDLAHLKFWECVPCGAYVGCHKHSKLNKPLGRLADKELRMWKQNAHALFDPIWKSGEMKRTDAYTWLSKHMGIEYHSTHIGMFDVKQCKEVVNICKTKRGAHRKLHDILTSIHHVINNKNNSNEAVVKAIRELVDGM